VLAVALLAPAAAARSGVPFGERVVALGYPVMDLAALVPTVVMIRIALAFRPGKGVARVGGVAGRFLVDGGRSSTRLSPLGETCPAAWSAPRPSDCGWLMD
jgi:hypothetical protein